MRGDRCSGESLVERRDDVGEYGRVGDIGGRDAVDVGRADGSLGIDAGCPFVEDAAPGVGRDDRDLDDPVLAGGQSGRLDVDHGEVRLALGRPSSLGRSRHRRTGVCGRRIALAESVEETHVLLPM
ncbi:hypothetical protein [Nocardioides sp. YIM 152315]|uniref:hypothetical protein n=1 Tax=Nocardioides sp. YIM 152315 TaxID=3031760 RepID=UPI0023DBD4BC|nr:hypothetical protein [Nocardioides sp. YIM 152315]